MALFSLPYCDLSTVGGCCASQAYSKPLGFCYPYPVIPQPLAVITE